MKVGLSAKDPLKVPADLVVFSVGKNWQEEINSLDSQVVKKIQETASFENFSGRKDQLLSIDSLANSQVKIILYGVDEDKIDVFKLQNTIACLMAKLKHFSRKKAVLVLKPQWHKLYDSSELARITGEAILLSAYRFDKYKSKSDSDKQIKLEEVLLAVHPVKLRAFETGLNQAEIYVRGTNFARDLVNEPGSHVTPSYLANCALDIAKNNKNIKVTILDKDEIKKLGMHAFLAVAKGSDHPAKFIKLDYKSVKPTDNKIVIIGKGITFDSGGLSLKPSGSMETMKCDMAGAAAVLGVFSQISKIAPKVNVTGLIAACENMPSGGALRPGDILTSLNGKTIEVLNTDAEGRLTLADVLAYGVKYEKPQFIVDLATLTGAVMVALGEEISGLFTNNEKFGKLVTETAAVAGELVWPMPMPEIYQPLVKSKIADTRNTSLSKYGGAITAALFLQQFVDKTPWVHLDIAGPAFLEKSTPLCHYGGTGFGVRTMLRLLGRI